MQEKDPSPGYLEGLISEPLKHPGYLEHAHYDHHAQEKENHVPVNGVYGLLIGEHDELLVECAQGMGDQKKHAAPRNAASVLCSNLKRYKNVHDQEYYQSDPEGRALESLHLHRGRCDERWQCPFRLPHRRRSSRGPPGRA